MYSYFPVFAYYLQDAITDPVRVGILRDLADADVVDGLAITVYKNEETQQITHQGYGAQYRLRIDFVYSVAVVSPLSEAVCNEAASRVVEALAPGSDIHCTYDGTPYSMYIEKVKDTVEFKNQFYVETVTFAGYTHFKEI